MADRTTHVVVTFDRLNQLITDVEHRDFPSDADAQQYARDKSNEGINTTVQFWDGWYRRGEKPVWRKSK